MYWSTRDILDRLKIIDDVYRNGIGDFLLESIFSKNWLNDQPMIHGSKTVESSLIETRYTRNTGWFDEKSGKYMTSWDYVSNHWNNRQNWVKDSDENMLGFSKSMFNIHFQNMDPITGKVNPIEGFTLKSLFLFDKSNPLTLKGFEWIKYQKTLASIDWHRHHSTIVGPQTGLPVALVADSWHAIEHLIQSKYNTQRKIFNDNRVEIFQTRDILTSELFDIEDCISELLVHTWNPVSDYLNKKGLHRDTLSLSNDFIRGMLESTRSDGDWMFTGEFKQSMLKLWDISKEVSLSYYGFNFFSTLQQSDLYFGSRYFFNFKVSRQIGDEILKVSYKANSSFDRKMAFWFNLATHNIILDKSGHAIGMSLSCPSYARGVMKV